MLIKIVSFDVNNCLFIKVFILYLILLIALVYSFGLYICITCNSLCSFYLFVLLHNLCFLCSFLNPYALYTHSYPHAPDFYDKCIWRIKYFDIIWFCILFKTRSPPIIFYFPQFTTFCKHLVVSRIDYFLLANLIVIIKLLL